MSRVDAPERAARARVFVDEVNARTVCAHCGAAKIEWHNPEHVELNRKNFRITSLAARGYPVAAIQAEMDRCTPLCRRCHMVEDGRMDRFKETGRRASVAAVVPASPCIACSRIYKPLRRGLCSRCYDRRRYARWKIALMRKRAARATR